MDESLIIVVPESTRARLEKKRNCNDIQYIKSSYSLKHSRVRNQCEPFPNLHPPSRSFSTLDSTDPKSLLPQHDPNRWRRTSPPLPSPPKLLQRLFTLIFLVPDSLSLPPNAIAKLKLLRNHPLPSFGSNLLHEYPQRHVHAHLVHAEKWVRVGLVPELVGAERGFGRIDNMDLGVVRRVDVVDSCTQSVCDCGACNVFGCIGDRF